MGDIIESPLQENHMVPIEPVIIEKLQLKNKIRIAISIILGAIGFGYTGIYWGEVIHPLGDSIIFLPFNFWFIVTIWGIILGLLTLNWRSAIILPVMGLVAGIASIIVGNLGGFFFIIILFGMFQIISYFLLPLVFLYYSHFFYKKRQLIHTAAFFILFLSGAIDWVLMAITFLMPNNYQQFNVLFHAPLFGNALIFAGVGVLIGAIFGYGIKKTETMALFGMMGLTIGSFWMSIFSDPYAYMTNVNDILIYTHVAATMGIFMVAGLFYPEKEVETNVVIPSTGEILNGSVTVDITQ